MSRAPSFYMTHPPQPFAVSTSVGSGKTRAATQYMASFASGMRNFLYVAPTIALVEQARKDLTKELDRSKSHRNVHMIHSQARSDDRGGTGDEVLSAINEVEGHMGRIVILTTPTFLDIIAQIDNPGDWSLILDEAFAPLDFLEFHLGSNAERGIEYFRETMSVLPDENYRVVPREGKKTTLQQVADRQWRKAGVWLRGIEPFARAVLNPAMRCELVATEKVKALLAGTWNGADEEEDDDEDVKESTMSIAAFVTPEYFADFEEVVFMSALFEHTILYALWRNVFGVEFQQHPIIEASITRDLHKEQGPHIAIGHLLHPNNNASKHNLSRNRHTAQPGETEVGERVIDWCVETADAYFGTRPYLLSVNQGYGYDTGTKLMLRFPGAQRIPVISHGLNDYSHKDNVAALAVCNPIPRYAKWIELRTGLTRAETYRAHRIHATYQAVGRSSIRNPRRAKVPKVFLTLGKEDADMLLTYFEGSQALGKIGSIPDLKQLEREASGRPPLKVRDLSVRIAAHVRDLFTSQDVRNISSREVKAAVAPETARETWRRAVKEAMQHLDEWGFRGASFVYKANLYGFVDESTADDGAVV